MTHTANEEYVATEQLKKRKAKDIASCRDGRKRLAEYGERRNGHF